MPHSTLTGDELHVPVPNDGGNKVVASPPDGSSGPFTGRALVRADMPQPNVVYIDDTDSPYTVTGDEDILICAATGGGVDVNLPPAAAAGTRPILIVASDTSGGNVIVYADVGVPDLIGFASGGLALTSLGHSDHFAYLQPDGVSRWVGFKLDAGW